MKRRRKIARIVFSVLFMLYMAVALYFLLFSDLLNRHASPDYRYNLELFREIKRFWEMRLTYGWDITLFNLLGNVACFIPFGYLVPSMTRSAILKNGFIVVLLGALFSTMIEAIQLVTKVGAFDVDDIFLNTVGALVGFVFFKIMYALARRRIRRQIRERKNYRRYEN